MVGYCFAWLGLVLLVYCFRGTCMFWCLSVLVLVFLCVRVWVLYDLVDCGCLVVLNCFGSYLVCGLWCLLLCLLAWFVWWYGVRCCAGVDCFRVCWFTCIVVGCVNSVGVHVLCMLCYVFVLALFVLLFICLWPCLVLLVAGLLCGFLAGGCCLGLGILLASWVLLM